MATITETLTTVFLLILITNTIKALPQTWYDINSDTSSSNGSHAQQNQRTKNSDHLPTQRKILSKGSVSLNNGNSGMDGKIVFPTEEPPIFSRFNPMCDNHTFCEDTSNYPTAYIDRLLQMNKDLQLFAAVDLIPGIEHRVNTLPEDASLCESDERLVYPKVAQSKDKEWLFVVNQGEFTQGVRVEICRNENNVCGVIDGFAEGYNTICKQKYIYRQLVAVSPAGQVKPEMFRFPASCCCHVKFSGNPLIRMGSVGHGKKNDVTTSKAH